MAERKFPTWATDDIADIGNGDPNKADPGAPKQASGWSIEKPLLQSMNWLQNLFGHFIKANNQVAPKATGYEAEAGERITMDNSAAIATLLLPANPLDGQWVEVGGAGLYSVYAVIISGNGNDVMEVGEATMEADDKDVDLAIFRMYWDPLAGTSGLWKARISSQEGNV